MKKFITTLLIMVMAVCGLAGCGSDEPQGDSKGTIVMGAKGFSENLIVAELYALALEDAGYTVERQYTLNTNVLHEALVDGEIDIYPEYSGTSYLNILGLETEFDRETVYNTVKEEYAEQFNVAALAESEINDTGCFVMLRETADKYGIKTVSDLQKNADKLIWGTYTAQGSDERAETEALEEFYGPFNFKEIRSIDSSLSWVALDNKEVDCDEGLTTQPQLLDDKYIALEEDIPCRLPYYLFPAVRQEVLDNDAEVETILNNVSSYLDNDVIIELVAKTDLDGEEYEDVAKEFYDANIAK